jgi:hypothetical protein
MFSKNTFIDTINLLEVAVRSEREDQITSFLIKNTILLLSLFFPENPEAILRIQEYCFEMNFGKPSPDSEYINPDDLYESLF